ncbi:MAG TPA: class I SAM-dependent methyltransferase [Burkholderiales bacterium]|nr:class I SAM-dependent methyltransferase [Burkholderiales bacterium]
MNNPASSHSPGDRGLLEVNRRFYDSLWAEAQLVAPERFNTWPLVCTLLSPSRPRLEIAPGLRPRLPIAGTHFVDISAPAVAKLHARGARAVVGLVSRLPFPDRVFDPVCALDIVEHVDDEDGALSELARVALPGAALLLSVPLHPSSWTPFDNMVGHRRRYEPERLVAKLAEHGFVVEQSAAYGMKPKSSTLIDLGMWFLEHRRERAMWWYRRVLMPLALRFQKKLTMVPGMMPTEQVDEVLLLCRRTGGKQ